MAAHQGRPERDVALQILGKPREVAEPAIHHGCTYQAVRAARRMSVVQEQPLLDEHFRAGVQGPRVMLPDAVQSQGVEEEAVAGRPKRFLQSVGSRSTRCRTRLCIPSS